MITFQEFGWMCLYYGLVSVVVALEHHFLYEKWRHLENARRAVGISTVMGLALLPTLILRLPQIHFWAMYVFGFAFAGLVKLIMDYRYVNKKKDELNEGL